MLLSSVAPILVTTVLASASAPTEILPLRRLRLYETGVGYFERNGKVAATSDLALPLPASHLDDALKTLIVLGDHEARVQRIQFASAISEDGARAMAGLPAGTDGGVGYTEVLESLAGSAVEIEHDRGRTRGILLEVEGPFETPHDPDAGEVSAEALEPWYALVIVDERGGVHRIRTPAIHSVQALDDTIRSRLHVAAESLSKHVARRDHPLDVRVSSSGRLGLGYIAESPVWRTTYRIVLPEVGAQAELQAWALVHNDTDEDWQGVQLELANGRPQSFLYPLAAPRYAWRELTGPEEDLSTIPQLANTTSDQMWGESFGVGGLDLVGTGAGGGGTGEGTIGLGSIGLIGHGGGGAGEPEIGDLAQLSQAEGHESGALFVYRVADPLDLRAHHSALVPLLHANLEAEPITWFARDDTQGLTAARIVNNTSQTLPAGIVSLFAASSFVGETALHRLKPKERQFVAFGTEQDIELDRDVETLSVRVVGVSCVGDELVEHMIVKTRVRIELRNRSGLPRRAFVGLDFDRNAQIETDAPLDFDDESETPLIITNVDATSSTTLVLTAETAETSREDLPAADRLASLVTTEGLPPEQRERIARALGHHREAETASARLIEQTEQQDRQEAELVRLREDLAALGRAGLRNRTTRRAAKRLLENERRLERLRDAIESLQATIERERNLVLTELKDL